VQIWAILVAARSILKIVAIFKDMHVIAIQIKAGIIFTFLNDYFPETFLLYNMRTRNKKVMLYH